MLVRFSALLLVAAGAGCTYHVKGLGEWSPLPASATDSTYAAQLEALRQRDPAQEARSALHTGQRYLLGVSGFALSVPGLERDWPRYAKQHGVRAFKGLNCELIVEGSAQQEYCRAAYEYARSYNAIVLAAAN